MELSVAQRDPNRPLSSIAAASFSRTPPSQPRALPHSRSVLPSEMKVPEVCDFENHKCDNGDEQEARQCNHFMPCLKHPISFLRNAGRSRVSRRRIERAEQKRHPHLGGFPQMGVLFLFSVSYPRSALRENHCEAAKREAQQGWGR